MMSSFSVQCSVHIAVSSLHQVERVFTLKSTRSAYYYVAKEVQCSFQLEVNFLLFAKLQ